jgi:hypothetical protein
VIILFYMLFMLRLKAPNFSEALLIHLYIHRNKLPLHTVFGQIFKVGEVCKKCLLPASLGSTHYCEFSAAFCTLPTNTSEIDPTEQKFTANFEFNLRSPS